MMPDQKEENEKMNAVKLELQTMSKMIMSGIKDSEHLCLSTNEDAVDMVKHLTNSTLHILVTMSKTIYNLKEEKEEISKKWRACAPIQCKMRDEIDELKETLSAVEGSNMVNFRQAEKLKVENGELKKMDKYFKELHKEILNLPQTRPVDINECLKKRMEAYVNGGCHSPDCNCKKN